MLRVFILLLAIPIVSCTSYFKKKSCEEINWFEHGQKVALRGQWLNADATLNECRKVEADVQESQLDRGFKSGVQKYCTNTNAYVVGKSGDLFARDLCEGPTINVLLQEHKQGLEDYCDKSNGYAAGSSGKKYQNVCPRELEQDFLPHYRKGRKKYVQSLIDSKSDDLARIEKDLGHKRRQLSWSQNDLRNLEFQRSHLEAKKATALSMQNSGMVSIHESEINSMESSISRKRSEISSTESDLRSLESRKAALMQEISTFKEELPGLD